MAGQIVRHLRLHHSIIAPLIVEGQIIGLLAILSDDLTEQDISAVSAFAHQVAAAWRKAELYEQAQHEIADRLQAEQETRRLKELNESIIQNAGEGIVIQDGDGTFTFVNPAAAAMLDYAPEDLIGQSASFVLPDDQIALVEEADRRRARGESDQYEIDLLRRDGRRFPILVSATPRRDPVSGEFTGSLSVFTDLSEHRLAQEQLRDSNRLLQTIYDTIPDAIISVDADFNILSCNPAVERILGYTPEELIGSSYLRLVPEELLADPAQRQADLYSSGYLSQEDFVFKKKDGELLPASFSVGLIRNEAGEVLGQVGSIRDVSERKRTEQLLRVLDQAALAMEKALTPREIFTAVAETLGELDIACVLFPADESQSRFYTRYLSYESKILRTAEKLAGVSHETFSVPVEELKEIDLFRKIVVERRTVFETDMAQILRQILPSPTKRFAHQIVNFLGVPRAIIAPLVLEDRVVGIFMTQSDDLVEGDLPAFSALAHQVAAAWRRAQLYEQAQLEIAERKRAEAEGERLLTEIQTQALRVQATIDAVPEGVLLLDANGQVVLANPVAVGYLDALADLSNKILPPTIVELGGRPLAELLGAPAGAAGHELERAGRAFEMVSRPIELGPTSGGWVLVIREVTEEREVQARMQQHKRLAAVGQMAAGIAHDFNNIMAVIILYSQMSLQVPDIPAKVQERLRTVVKQADRAADLIEQILDFSRRAVLERQPLDLLPLLIEETKLLERTLPESIQVQLGYGEDEYTVSADSTRIQQAIVNLAVNARDAMPDGGVLRLGIQRVRVLPGDRPPLPEMEPGEWILITVEDGGEGISPDALPHIFEPFFTTKPAGAGSGLGLAQVYGIVSQHGGYIGVETELGHGSFFSIYLPALTVSKRWDLPGDEISLEKGLRQRILVVEDDLPTRRALVACLEELNYRVLTAANGREALDLYQAEGEKIDLVLTDLVMPEMGGKMLSERLRQLSPDLKMIVLSGYPLEGESAAAESNIFADWLRKPVALDKLAEVVARVLSPD